jgi:DNA-binding NtrC family response regulator
MVRVEDETLIRWDLAASLREAGYETVEAENAQDAISILEADRSIKVVFTDIRMPGTYDGLQLARCIRRRWPPTIIVISSGNIPTDASLMPEGVHVLTKPYSSSKLTKVCDEIADQLSA